MKREDFITEGLEMPPKSGSTRHEEEYLTHAGYQACGGIINEKDYVGALLRAESLLWDDVPASQQEQVSGMIRDAGLDLSAMGSDIDPRVLYSVLRGDDKPKGIVHHHAQMDDQHLFREVFLMLEEPDAALTVERAYPNIF